MADKNLENQVIEIPLDEYNELLKLKENVMNVNLHVNVTAFNDKGAQLDSWTIDSLSYPDVKEWLNHPLIGDIHEWQTKCVYRNSYVKEVNVTMQNLNYAVEKLKKENANLKKNSFWSSIFGGNNKG